MSNMLLRTAVGLCLGTFSVACTNVAIANRRSILPADMGWAENTAKVDIPDIHPWRISPTQGTLSHQLISPLSSNLQAFQRWMGNGPMKYQSSTLVCWSGMLLTTFTTSYQAFACHSAGEVAARVEVWKTEKYSKLSHSLNFNPILIESTGVFGPYTTKDTKWDWVCPKLHSSLDLRLWGETLSPQTISAGGGYTYSVDCNSRLVPVTVHFLYTVINHKAWYLQKMFLPTCIRWFFLIPYIQ